MTQMMEQYFEVKNNYKDYLLFYRIGDFYEMFFEDAQIGSKVLDLTLTGRDWGEAERAPMCGIPFHAVDTYIGPLVEAGYRIAICEQMEDPSLAKGLVRREVIRVVTPGTVVETSLLPEGRNNYLSAIMVLSEQIGISFCDISTGQLSATMFSGDNRCERLSAELVTYQPSEILLNGTPEDLGSAKATVIERMSVTLQPNQQHRFDKDVTESLVAEHFGDKYAVSPSNTVMTQAIGAMLSYIIETQKIDISYIADVNVYSEAQFLEIDTNTRRNLELCETMRSKEKKGSLLWVIDRTKTSMGTRMLRSWLELPLINSQAINRRLDAVEELTENFMLREESVVRLDGMYDLERLTTKVVYGNANPRDVYNIALTLAKIPELRAMYTDVTASELQRFYVETENFEELTALIMSAVKSDASLLVRDGNIIAEGYNEEVDRLRAIVKDNKNIINEMAEHEREVTGIKNLKIGYNRVFGYYIEVTNSQKSLVPDTYIRKQTLTGGERYITKELKDTEATVLGAADRLNNLEYELFQEICGKINEVVTGIKKTASRLAALDCYLSLAEIAVRGNYVRPEVDYGTVIQIKDGRHPVVEKFVTDGYFVPNDTLLDVNHNRMMLITGPNMAGKSTYMRQVALITVLAQIGSFVPATEARIGICDKIFTRVGASDDLASGQSTFMLEMNECAYILKNATKRSLIVYDEIGRGTSTYDGMSIARAIAEYTADKIGAKTLFATHYHELCDLEEGHGIVNYNIAAKKKGDDVTFLRKIIRGSTDDSFGIEVAKLAGVPNSVTKRAKEILASLLSSAAAAKAAAVGTEEAEPEAEPLTIDSILEKQLADEVRAIDLNILTPIEAINVIDRLKKIIC